MNYVVSTVGLSCLTNGLNGLENKEIYRRSNKSELEKEFKERFDKEFDNLKKDILEKSEEDLKKLSAELNSLFSFGIRKNDYHKLLVTDTYLGKKAGELIQIVLKDRVQTVEVYSPTDLKTSNLTEFQLSLSEIVKDLSFELDNYRKSNYKIIFNLTGGFKSINAFMQSMASLWADMSIYKFETSNELLAIPRLPIKIDEDIFSEKIDVFRRLELSIDIEDKDILMDIPKTLIFEMDGEYSLSPWGEIIWQKVKMDLYQNLVNSLSGKIVYSKEFKKDFEKLSSNEKIQINKSIDKLEKYILNGESLKSLNYHSLSGEIASKYSHEFYGFDGNDSRRVYCNQKDENIVIEKIGSHLK